MATVRQYGYYIKGNKVSIVEKDTAFDNDVNSKDYGPGADRAQWKSPLASIDDGLEIEYSYSPTFQITGKGPASLDGDYFRFIGYGSRNGYLTLFTYKEDDVNDLTGTGDGRFTAGDWILIEGSSRWSGLHQVKSTTTAANEGDVGILILDVPFHLESSFLDKTAAYYTNNTLVYGGVQDDNAQVFKDHLIDEGGESHYFIAHADTTADNGFFTSVVNETNATFQIGNKITIDYDTGAYTTTEHTLTEDLSDGSTTTMLHQAFYDPMIVWSSVSVIQDESFDVNLPSYLNKALVYYMKAKAAEDVMNIEAKEYFMSEFRKIVEKYNNTRVAGLRIQAPGPFAIK